MTSLLLAALAAASPASAPAPSNLLIVTLDTTRADRLGCYGRSSAATENIDRLAADGVTFHNAFTTAPITLPAHSSLFSALYPPRHGVRDNADYRLPESVVTLAERLQTAGYRNGAVVASAVLDRGLGLEQGFSFYDDLRRSQPPAQAADSVRFEPIAERNAQSVTDQALRWLRTRDAEPFFLWVHYFDPHDDYAPPEPFRTRFRTDPYQGEIAFVDQELGRLLRSMAQSQQLERTLVVITADHGEGLGNHQEATHGVYLYDSTLRIPLLMRFPRRALAGTHYRGLFSAVDLAPTLLELLGIGAFENVDGVSHAGALRAGQPLQRAPIYAETLYSARAYGWSEQRALRSLSRKYIRNERDQLFDLASDPIESRDLAASQLDELSGWVSQLDRLLAHFGDAPSQADQPADRERLEILQSLGYASGASGRDRAVEDSQAASQRAARAATLDRAREAIAAGRRADAARWARQVLEAEPNNPAAHGLLGISVDPQTEPQIALQHLRRAAELAPTVFEHSRNLGVLLAQRSDWPGAITALRRAAALRPGAADLQFLLGNALRESGQSAAALESFERAHRLDYRSVSLYLAWSQTHRQRGEWIQAASRLRQALELEPASSEPRAALIRLHLERPELGSPDREIAQLRRDPRQRDWADLFAAHWLLIQGDPQRARQQLESIIGTPTRQQAVREAARRLLNTVTHSP